MHILLRERHGLEEGAVAEDLGQAPADLIVLSFSDSDLAAFASAWRAGRDVLPSLRLANLARLRHPLSVDLFLENTAAGARAILVRLLGGLDYWRYGLDELSALAKRHCIALAVVPGDGRPDPALAAYSTVPVDLLDRLKVLTDTGGTGAARAALAELARAAGLAVETSAEPAALPRFGFYAPGCETVRHPREGGNPDPTPSSGPETTDALQLSHMSGKRPQPRSAPAQSGGENWQAMAKGGGRPRALVTFYRAFLAAADTEPVDKMYTILQEAGFEVAAVFLPSLKDRAAAAWLTAEISRQKPDVIVNLTAFSAAGDNGRTPFSACDAPVLQVALAGSDRNAWAEADRGLSPADLAMHVVLPEIDGRIFAGVASFKAAASADPDLGFAPLQHRAEPERIAAIARRAVAFARLRRTPRAERKLAILLSTYPGRADQTAHAVGLDAPASACAVLQDLAVAGYDVADHPKTGAKLLARLAGTAKPATWPLASYRRAYGALPEALRRDIETVWGPPETDPAIIDGYFVYNIACCGNVIVALQPERGRPETRTADYHDARRPPRHAYVAFYLWLREAAGIDALIHMGAHGTLEWLPGKSVALSNACAPEALIGPLPVVYPFIVNDPGEAANAKRRIAAVTIGHMTPPLRLGALTQGLAEVERLLDEFSTADGLDPRRREALARSIVEAARDAGLDREIGLDEGLTDPEAVTRLDAFVCDVKATQFLDGLHVFGRAPDEKIEIAGRAYADCASAEATALIDALDGRAVAPGPAGSPWRGRADVLPTGRNLFAVDPRAVPSRAAAEAGNKLADAVITRHLQDHGDYPDNVVVDLWGSATMRTAGEEFAMALALIGVRPVWDAASSRVSGFEIVSLAELGRPRIDVALRISGLFRDVFPGLADLFAKAVAALGRRDEPADENPYRTEADIPRIFGPAPGSYGLAMGDALTDLTEAGRDRAAEAWLAGSAHAYGTGDGAPARAALEARVAAAGAFVHPQDLPETDLFLAADYAAHEAGFAAAARRLTGSTPALYHADTTIAGGAKIRTLAEESARIARGRAANPAWIAGQLRHGFAGAAALAATLDQMAAFAHLADAVASRHFDLYFDATLGDDTVRDSLARDNPAALAEMMKRFRDLIAAGHWQPRRNSVAAILQEKEPHR